MAGRRYGWGSDGAGETDVHLRWIPVTEDGDARSLDILVATGGCERLDGVSHTESAEAITLDVRGSHDGEELCSLAFEVTRATVQLNAPLGDRRVGGPFMCDTPSAGDCDQLFRFAESR